MASSTECSLLARARAAGTSADCTALYAQWAATYNADLADPSQEYVAPIKVAQAALRFGARALLDEHATATVLDAGCGTGLVAEHLARGMLDGGVGGGGGGGGGGVQVAIDGLDLSPDMLREARKTGVYRELALADLTGEVQRPDDGYDVVTCCGTFTHGHVGPDPALRTFVRVVKPAGVVVATVLDELWEVGGFRAEVERLEKEKLVKVLSADVDDYRKGKGDRARLLVLEKVGVAPGRRQGVAVAHAPVAQAQQSIVSEA
jgi:SAM-dependent methyltransferase